MAATAGVKGSRGREFVERFSCDECGSDELTLDPKRGEMSCRSCGVVAEEDIQEDQRAERIFDDNTREKRLHDAVSSRMYYDKNLGSTFRLEDGANAPDIDPNMWKRLETWNQRAKDHEMGNFKKGAMMLRGTVSRLDLPGDVMDRAVMIFKKAHERGMRGTQLEKVVAASVYTASREAELSRDPDEVAEDLGVDRRGMMRERRKIASELDSVNISPSDPTEYMPRICSELDISPVTETLARRYLSDLDEEITSGRNPSCIAASLVYMATQEAGERRTQEEIAEAAGVSAVAIRNNYKRMEEELELDLNVRQKNYPKSERDLDSDIEELLKEDDSNGSPDHEEWMVEELDGFDDRPEGERHVISYMASREAPATVQEMSEATGRPVSTVLDTISTLSEREMVAYSPNGGDGARYRLDGG